MDDFDTIEVEAQPEFQAPEAEEADAGYPSCRYGPNGQSGVFLSAADVPHGWKDHPSKVPGAPDPSLLTSERRPGKAEIMKDLKRREIDFKPMQPASELHALLVAAQAKDVKREQMAVARAAPRKPKKAKKK